MLAIARGAYPAGATAVVLLALWGIGGCAPTAAPTPAPPKAALERAPTPTVSLPSKTPAAPAAVAARDLPKGMALYASKGCAACHGPSGEGGAAPALRGHDERQVRKQVREPKGTMPALTPAQLSDAELDEIAAYIASLGPAEAPHGHAEAEMLAPSGLHLHLALLALKADNMPDATHHIRHLIDFAKTSEVIKEGEKIMGPLRANKVHDAEHEIEERLPKEMGPHMTAGSMHLELALDQVRAGKLDDTKHHLRHIIDLGVAEKPQAEKALAKLNAGDTHEAKEVLEKALGKGH